MDVVLAVVGKIAEYTVEPIWRQLGYLVNYDDNIHSLKAQIDVLKKSQRGVKRKADAAGMNGEEVEPDVTDWIEEVDVKIRESEEVNKEVNENQMWSFRPCPNVVMRYKVSRKAKKMKSILELLHNNKFEKVASPAPPPQMKDIFPYDIETSESRTSTFDNIMEALKDDKTHVIGVYGMGGIGKTTLVKAIAKRAENDNLFDGIAMAVVSQSPSIKKIQDEIAEKLGLELDEKNTELVRAACLHKRIMKSPRVLVILDDLWTKLDLGDIGIPRANHHEGCKILLTTREEHVCIGMDSEPTFDIKVLLEREAWNLFREKAGDVADSKHLKTIPRDIAKECAGLPLAVVTVAGALRKNEDICVWKDALLRLQNPAFESLQGVSEIVYSSLKLSYDFLGSNEVKDCFLLCCVAPEDSDILITQLVRMGMGLRLFSGVSTWEDVMNRVRALVNKLKSCCLLLDGEIKDSVRMHDVIRDFAISVASKTRLGVWARINVGESGRTNNLLASDDNDAKIPLHNNFHQLPAQIDSPRLELLWIHDSHYDNPTVIIPEKFFERMEKLRVLIVVKAVIPRVPSLFQSLVKLRVLCLEGCQIDDLPLIGEQKGLEILSITNSSAMKELPREFGQLTQLRVLDLKN